MGLWPFGRDPADVEITSRIITASTRDNVQVRGKLTLHFAEPQTQAAADNAADRCAALMEMVLREHPIHDDVLGSEAEMARKLLDRLPADIAPTRALELAALHIVGDPGSSARRRAAGMAIPPSSAVPLSLMPPASLSIAPPPPSAGSTPSRRRSSNRARVMTASLSLPVGASLHAIGAALAPLVRDSAARLLIGFLRIHDLVAVRGVRLENGSPDLQSAVSTILESREGEHEASRAGEIARWQAVLGAEVTEELRHEANITSIYLLDAALIHAEVPQDLALKLLEECCAKAFPDERSPRMEVTRYLGAASIFPSALASRVTQILGGMREPSSMIPALVPLLSLVEEDNAVAATLAKHSLDL